MTHRKLLRASLTAVAACLASAALSGSSALAQSVVSMPTNLRSGTGLDVAVPIRVAPADGVTAMDFVFDYDPAVLTATGVYRTGFTDGFNLASDLSVAGTVEISLSAGGPLSGSGDVAWVVFRVTGAPGAFSNLAWVSAALNGGGIPSSTRDGKVTVASAQVVLSMPDTAKGAPGTQVQVPIAATAFTGAESFDIELRFNPAVISAVRVDKTPLTAPMTLVSNLTVPGLVVITLYHFSPISGSGPVVQVTFSVAGGIGRRTPLDLTRGDINETLISTLLDDGLFTVCDGADGDGDGVTGCAGDCDNADARRYPGNAETCDGVDNDCDLSVDEGFALGAACSAGVGACRNDGVTVCTADGLGTECDAIPLPPLAPTDTTCDGIDDDCDGSTDEEFEGQPTSCGVGACSSVGLSQCIGGQVDDGCVPNAPAPDDATCDAVDDDCDGSVDEDYASAPTSCGVGACAATGTTSCVAGAVVDSCTPGTPAVEVCDLVDNDCDGTVDNAAVPAGTPALTVAPAPPVTRLSWTAEASSTGYDLVRGDAATLRGSGGDFTAATGSCLGNDLAGTSYDETGSPGVGAAFWYLVRPVNCGGAGTYDSGSSSQSGPRDAEIDASAGSCP